jgi:carbon monoxide dehydrogenase subunit G
VHDPLTTVALVTPFGSVRNDVRIRRSAADVWRVIADVGSVAEWFPSFRSSRVEGTQRVIVTNTGMSLVEDVLRVDHEQRRFQYAIVPNGAIREHRATVDVVDLGDESCLVVYSTDMAPAVLVLALSGAIAEALDNLRDRLETPVAGS